MAATLAGSGVLALAFPDRAWWWCAPIGIALHLIALRGQRLGRAAGLGFAGGLVFYLLHVQWTSLFLGPVPWVALSALMGLWWLVGGMLIAAAYRRLGRLPGRLGRYGMLPLAIAGLWTLRETLSSALPYGGFAWGRIAQSQSNSPLIELVSLVGFSGLTFAIVLWVALAIEVVARRRRWGENSDGWRIGARITGLAAAAGLLAVVPQWPTAHGEPVRILAVQGDTPGASYFIPAERGEILLAHAQTTLDALEDAGDLDLVLWPEGSVDVSPLDNYAAEELLNLIEEQAGAPILMNTVTRTGDYDDPATEFFNSQLLWDAGGVTEQYDKAHPIPFGEYVPDRDFFMALAPDLIGLIQRGYSPGTLPNVLEVNGTGYGVFICYDIVDDSLARDAARGDAGVLLAPTNNADFGRSDESAQQLATARLRAVEAGKPLVQASTVGWSAAYAADGTELAALDWYEPGAFVVEVQPASGLTPATAFGEGIDVLLGGLGLALLLGAPRALLPGTSRALQFGGSRGNATRANG
jgi:apolipoprotein N-acyltransferase